MKTILALSAIASILHGCAVASVAGAIVSTTASATGTVLSTTVSIVGAGMKKAAGSED